MVQLGFFLQALIKEFPLGRLQELLPFCSIELLKELPHSNQTGFLLCIELSVFLQQKSDLLAREQSVILCYKSDLDLTPEILKELKAAHIVEGLLNFSKPETVLPIYRAYKKRREAESAAEEVVTLGKSINSLVTHSLNELVRVKELHERIVPIRKEKFPSGEIWAKFAAGGSNGGDFFDIFTGDRESLLLFSSTNSYVVSSAILAQASLFRASTVFSDERIKHFVSALSLEIKKAESNAQALTAELMVVRLDHKTLTMNGYLFGAFELVSSKKEYQQGKKLPIELIFAEQAAFTQQLARGEKLLFLSSGVRNNLKGLFQGKELVSSLFDLINKEKRDIFNDIFFEMKKKNIDQDFLTNDATAIIFEVFQHAIHQV